MKRSRSTGVDTRLFAGVFAGAVGGMIGKLLVVTIASLVGAEVLFPPRFGARSAGLVPISEVPLPSLFVTAAAVSVVPAVAAGLALWLLEKFTVHALTILLVVIAGMILVGDILAILGVGVDPRAGVEARWVLAAQHTITAVAIMGALAIAGRRPLHAR